MLRILRGYVPKEKGIKTFKFSSLVSHEDTLTQDEESKDDGDCADDEKLARLEVCYHVWVPKYNFIFFIDKPVKMNNHADAGPDWEKKIKDLDYISLIFSLIYFITFALVYWIIVY